MSKQTQIRRITVPQIAARKGGDPIVSLTSYHAHTAAIVDKVADFILVGDSLGMVMHGMNSTVGVPLDLMIMHGRAVVRGTERALIVVDMPFGSYEESPNMAFRNAAKIMKETQCGAVKLEGGARMAETIRFLTERGVPVMAHIGLTPQSSHVMGGFKTQGREEETWDAHIADAKAVAEAGAFAVVVEGVVEPLAVKITRAIDIPTIGIGASAACDGQILVLEDMLGLSPWTPKFVKVYGRLGDMIEDAVRAYADEVKSRAFPGEDHVYRMETIPATFLSDRTAGHRACRRLFAMSNTGRHKRTHLLFGLAAGPVLSRCSAPPAFANTAGAGASQPDESPYFPGDSMYHPGAAFESGRGGGVIQPLAPDLEPAAARKIVDRMESGRGCRCGPINLG